MKLTAPVYSYQSCIAQIDAGADEIFLGLKVDFFKRMSFSARPQFKNGRYVMPDKEEFKRIVDYAKARNVAVFLTANTSFFSDYPIEGIDIEREYINYVEFALECKVDAVIVADIGLMQTLKKAFPDITIFCSTLLDVDNVYQLKFLKELNVKRTVLSYQATMEEIIELANSNIMDLEIFGYGGCSFATNCMLGHSEKYGIPCENFYYTEKHPNMSRQICAALNCSLCAVWDLKNYVCSIKIQGRERDYNRVVPLTKMYRKAIDIAESCESKDEYVKRIVQEQPMWWKKMFCENFQCKFEAKNNQNAIMYVEGKNIL